MDDSAVRGQNVARLNLHYVHPTAAARHELQLTSDCCGWSSFVLAGVQSGQIRSFQPYLLVSFLVTFVCFFTYCFYYNMNIHEILYIKIATSI